MKTPIIIPAYNEAARISPLLESLTYLPEGAVEVVVSSNGSTDETVAVAESFKKHRLRSKNGGLDMTVLDRQEQGQIPAIQAAVQYLADKAIDSALNPFIYIDADAVPKDPAKWLDRMVEASEPLGERPVVVSGPVRFTPRDPNDKVSPVVRTVFRLATGLVTASAAASSGKNGGHYAPNMAFHLHDEAVLERFLTFNVDEDGNHYEVWPRGDVALTQAVVNDGEGVFKQLIDQKAVVYAPESNAFPPLLYTLRHGLKKSEELTIQTYEDTAAPGAITFRG